METSGDTTGSVDRCCGFSAQKLEDEGVGIVCIKM